MCTGNAMCHRLYGKNINIWWGKRNETKQSIKKSKKRQKEDRERKDEDY